MTIENVLIKVIRQVGVDGAQDIRMSFDGDDAYVAGGTADFTEVVKDAIEAAAVAASDSNIRGGQPNLEVVEVISADCGIYLAKYDQTNDKLKAVVGSTGVENATGDISGVTFNVTVLCK
jgi:hypothetical protein